MEPITTSPQDLDQLLLNHLSKAEFDTTLFTTEISKLAESHPQPDSIVAKIFEASKKNINPATLDFSEKMINVILESFYVKKPKFQDILFFPSPENEIKFLNYLKLAKKSLKVCVFTLSSDHIANCLRELHEKGINVRIITDDEFVEKQGSDIMDLVREGIPVRTDENAHALMHNKFCVIDDQILITGSYNWTGQATYYNQENVVIIDNPHIVKTFSEHFEELWVKYEKFNLDKQLGTAVHKTKLYENQIKDDEKKKKHEEKEEKKKSKDEAVASHKKPEKVEKIEVESADKAKPKTTRARKPKADAGSEEKAAPIGEGSKKIRKQKSDAKSDSKTEPASGKRARNARKTLKEESLSEEDAGDSDSDFE